MRKVQLVRHTADPDRVVALAARICYSGMEFDDLNEKITDKAAAELVAMLRRMGHESPFEHASFTFCVEGVSRTATHQFVRHRIASYSQQSQRYVKAGEDEKFVVPPEIEGNAEAKEKVSAHYRVALKLYFELLDMGVKKEDARYVLPEGAETRIMATMNARELFHFFSLRCCNRAQWEIRAAAVDMLQEAKKVAPLIFEGAGPGCLRGPCPEKEYSCGKSAEVREFFKALDESIGKK
ncbi:MAG TPA: FAD-dependent thymidylate synthase [bacterium]|nr:FAD-dependent thymidylate synthase [bacterium]